MTRFLLENGKPDTHQMAAIANRRFATAERVIDLMGREGNLSASRMSRISEVYSRLNDSAQTLLELCDAASDAEYRRAS